MRCGSCHTYIPEGLAEPVLCPQCGKTQAPAGAAAPTTGSVGSSAAFTPALSPSDERQGPAIDRQVAATAAGPTPSRDRDGNNPGSSTTPPTGPSWIDSPYAPAGSKIAATPDPAYSRTTAGGASQESEWGSAERSAGSAAFAPYFTIQTPLVFGPAASASMLRQPTIGSLSFGADGFAIVSDGGRQWEKIRYHDLSVVRTHDDSVMLLVRDVESRLTLYHSWLPTWLAGPRRRRAATVAELLARVRAGLTPYEISLYRRRLK